MIYFARIEETGLVKIGCTANLQRRLTQHRWERGDVTFLFGMDGDVGTERALHRSLQERRIGTSECFRLSDEDLRAIDAIISEKSGYVKADELAAIAFKEDDGRKRRATGRVTSPIIFRTTEEKRAQILRIADVLGLGKRRPISMTEVIERGIDALERELKGGGQS